MEKRPLTMENDFAEFLTRRDAGERVTVDDGLADYFLDVLPPVYMGRVVTLADGTQVRAAFGFAEGQERITAFWYAAGQWYAQYTTEIAR